MKPCTKPELDPDLKQDLEEMSQALCSIYGENVATPEKVLEHLDSPTRIQTGPWTTFQEIYRKRKSWYDPGQEYQGNGWIAFLGYREQKSGTRSVPTDLIAIQSCRNECLITAIRRPAYPTPKIQSPHRKETPS